MTPAASSTLAGLVESGLMAADWADALVAVDPGIDSRIATVQTFLDQEEASGRGHLPARDMIFRAFAAPLADVRVLIVGQDPYPTPGHPIGLSFAVAPDVRPLPRSLVNIYRELESDLQITPAAHGDLTAWADQGVLLLNRVLSVGPGQAGSHRRRGWEPITDAAIGALARRGGPCAAILWGRDAQRVGPALGTIPSAQSPHPSPLSAGRGFFGSRPFSQVNALLVAQGAQPIDWRVE